MYNYYISSAEIKCKGKCESFLKWFPNLNNFFFFGLPDQLQNLLCSVLLAGRFLCWVNVLLAEELWGRLPAKQVNSLLCNSDYVKAFIHEFSNSTHFKQSRIYITTKNYIQITTKAFAFSSVCGEHEENLTICMAYLQ